MADYDTDVEDAASLMEKLWGPREQAPPDAVVVPMKDLWGPGRGVELPQVRRTRAAPEPTVAPEPDPAPAAATPDMDALREGVEAALTERLTSVRAELISAAASVEERLNRRVDALAEEAAAADAARPVAVASEDVIAAADARVALAEKDLLARLDDVHEQIRVEMAVLASSIPDPDLARASLDEQLAPIQADLAAAGVRSGETEQRLLLRIEDAANRVAAVGERLDGEIGQVAEALGRVEAASVTGADLEAVRSAIEVALGEARVQLQSAQADAATRLEEVRIGLKNPADATAASVTHLEGRLDGLTERLSAATVDLVESVRADHVAVQSFQHRLELVRAEIPFRLQRATDDLRARSVSREDLAAARSELKRLLTRRLTPIEAEARRVAVVLEGVTAGVADQVVDRLDEMAAWVLAQATRAAAPSPRASRKRDSRAVKSPVDGVDVSASALNGPVSRPARRSTSNPTAAEPPTKATDAAPETVRTSTNGNGPPVRRRVVLRGSRTGRGGAANPA
jgi:hypothetical protein